VSFLLTQGFVGGEEAKGADDPRFLNLYALLLHMAKAVGVPQSDDEVGEVVVADAGA
jgi:hypothetical protein